MVHAKSGRPASVPLFLLALSAVAPSALSCKELGATPEVATSLVPETAAPSATLPAAPAPPLPPIRELDPPEVSSAKRLAALDPRFEVVRGAVDQKTWKTARTALNPLLTSEADASRLDVWAASKELAAWLALLDGDDKRARAHHAELLLSAKNPWAMVRRIESESAGASREEGDQRLATVLNAWGQARFAEGEDLRRAASKISLPKFSGPRTNAGVDSYMKKEASTWMLQRRDAIDKAERAFVEVTNIKPVPPPRWLIASAERVGTMWSDFAVEFESVPRPDEWKNTPEVAEAFRQVMSSASEPIRANARNAFRTCASLLEKYRMVDAHLRTCIDRMAK
jgi:hypothetical protein